MEQELLSQARELQEFFIGTYVESVIEDAIESDNEHLLKLVVRQYENERENIEFMEESHV